MNKSCDSSASGTLPPENSLFTATINASAILCEFTEILTHVIQKILYMIWVICVTPTVMSLFSSALLHIEPCPCDGETCMSFHAEQGCTGLWCGVIPRGLHGRKLQCKYWTSCWVGFESLFDHIKFLLQIYRVEDRELIRVSCVLIVSY